MFCLQLKSLHSTNNMNEDVHFHLSCPLPTPISNLPVPVTVPQGYLPPTKNGVEPKRPSRPINITSLVRLTTTVPNTIIVSWTSEIGRVNLHHSASRCA